MPTFFVLFRTTNYNCCTAKIRDIYYLRKEALRSSVYITYSSAPKAQLQLSVIELESCTYLVTFCTANKCCTCSLSKLLLVQKPKTQVYAKHINEHYTGKLFLGIMNDLALDIIPRNNWQLRGSEDKTILIIQKYGKKLLNKVTKQQQLKHSLGYNC